MISYFRNNFLRIEAVSEDLDEQSNDGEEGNNDVPVSEKWLKESEQANEH